MEGFHSFIVASGQKVGTASKYKRGAEELARLAGSYGIALSTVASVAALRSVRGLSLSAAQVTALNLVEGYFDSLERPEAHAPSTEAPTIGGKRVRGLEGGVQQARAGAGGVMVACLGPPLKKADALVGLGSMLEGDYETSFFVTTTGHYHIGDFSERDKSLSLAPCCNETEGEDGRDLPLITGFECVSVPRPARAEPVMIHAYGDKPFKHSMRAAIMAVRLRAASLCRQLGVQDVDKAVARLGEEGGPVQLVLRAEPHKVYMQGGSASLAAGLSVVALMTGRRLKPTLAATGELSLSGRVGPVSGLPEKLASARHYGITTLLCPPATIEEYQRELQGAEAQEGVELIGVATLEEAVRYAFDDTTDRQPSEAENGQMEISIQEDGEADEEEEGHTDVEGGEGRRKRKHGEVEGTEESGQAEGRKRRHGSGAFENDAAAAEPSEIREGHFHGAAQSLTWQLSTTGQMASRVLEVEVVLYPGRGCFELLNHVEDTILAEIDAASVWLSTQQGRLVPGPRGFLLPDFASQRPLLNLMTHTNPSGELFESHLGAAYAVAMAAAITGYAYNPKAAIVGIVTSTGYLPPMAGLNRLDVLLLCTCDAKVIVVPQGNISDIERICRENPNMQEDTRFIGVKNLVEALPHLLLGYPTVAHD